jgi:hypothetical protein
MNFSNYLEQQLLGHTLLRSTFTAPTTLYLSLATSLASDGDSFTEVPPGTGYARELLNGNLSGPTSGPTWTVVNSNAITFTTATTGWGSVTHFGIHDASAGGNLLYWGTLSTPRTVTDSDVLEVPVGNLSVLLD